MKGFQVGVLVFFGVFVLLGVLIFSGVIKLPSKNSPAQQVAGGQINIWGTIPGDGIYTSLSFLNSQGGVGGLSLSYQEKDPRTYEQDILNAFAFGGVPDLFFISQELIHKYEDKLILIPFTYFPERTFNETYIRAADIFKRPQGFLGFPVFVDPLIMYYNQDLLESENFTFPPSYWKDFFDYIPRLTKKNEAAQVTISGVALGEFSNVKNAKEIFAAMNLQLGNEMIVYDYESNRPKSIIDRPSSVSYTPAIQSLNFFNEFSNPLNEVYSWNKSKPNSENAFIAGDLAIYFGLSSELRSIQQKNPNLNFDIAELPQVKELNNKITYADVYALAIPRNSPNAQTAIAVAANLANGANTYSLVAPSGFAPMRRDLISANRNTGNYNPVIYDSALYSRSWLDINTEETYKIFERMVESVVSGLSDPREAVENANIEIRTLITK